MKQKIAKSVRKNQSSTNTSHISSVINGGFDLDKEISELSTRMFELDKESKFLLEILTKNGPFNEYQLEKYGSNYDMSRYLIRRRIHGSSEFPSLKENDFVTLLKNSPQRTKRKHNTFSLTFKGTLASLSRIQFEKNYNIQKYYDFVRLHIGNEFSIMDYSMLFAKYQIALVLSWYSMINKSLLHHKTIQHLFIEGVTNNLLFGGNFMPTNAQQRDLCFDIAKKFLVLRDILGIIIDKICIDKNSVIFSNLELMPISKNYPKITDKTRAKIILESLTLDWAFNLARTYGIPGVFNRFKIFPYVNSVAGYTFHWQHAKKEMNELAKNILKDIGIERKHDVRIVRKLTLRPLSAKADSIESFWPVLASYDRR